MALLPGSFNPLHAGHRELAAAARRLLGQPVAFELSITNVDKASLGAEEVRRRLAQFAGAGDVWLTRAPTFVEKARLFAGSVFVVGADTAERVIDPRYYGGGVWQALDLIRRHECRFLVAARRDAAGQLRTLEQLPLPRDFSALFLPLADFRFDISSTELRRQGE